MKLVLGHRFNSELILFHSPYTFGISSPVKIFAHKVYRRRTASNPFLPRVYPVISMRTIERKSKKTFPDCLYVKLVTIEKFFSQERITLEKIR